MDLMSVQDLAALTVIASFIGGVVLWLGSKLFATRSDVETLKDDIRCNTEETSIIRTDVKWIKARLSGNEFPD